jgi:hypothetical protein
VYFRAVPPQRDFSRVGAGYPSDPQDGTAYVRAAFGSSLMFSLTNGSTFDLASVDLAEYSTVFQEPVTVHFIGYRQDGTTVSEDFETDGIIDGTGPLADFQTFYFGREFSDLSRVEIPTLGWSLDNLSISVPEPAFAALLVAGALTFGIARKLGRSS